MIVIPTDKSFERIYNMELHYRRSSDFRLRVTQAGYSPRSTMHHVKRVWASHVLIQQGSRSASKSATRQRSAHYHCRLLQARKGGGCE